MNRLKLWVMGAALICSSSVFTGCSKSDDGDVQEPVVKPDPVVNPDPDDNGANSGSEEIGYKLRKWTGEEVVYNEKAMKATDIRTIARDNYYSGAFYISGTYNLEGFFGVDEGKTVDLILCDDAELKVHEIRMGSNSTLRIYGQEKDTGKLRVVAPHEGYAGIGTNTGRDIVIEIYGGDITTFGYNGAAGIGCGWRSGYYGKVKSITIYGGSIKATGGSSAAGIGSGYRANWNSHDPDSGVITIYGGTVEAKGGGYYYGVGSDYNYDGGPGIGSGILTKLGTVNIYGGYVIALGGHKASGIGTVGFVSVGEVNIYGGNVIAGGGKNGAGIGGGQGTYPEKINIHGGTVYAYAGADAAGIGGGEDGDSGDITITGGTIRAYGNKELVSWETIDKVTTLKTGNNSGYGAGIGSGQDGSVNKIIIKGGDIEAYGGEDAAGIGTGEEYTADGINSGTIEIHGGKVWAEGKGYGAGIGCGEDATFGVLGISGGRVDAHAGSDCGPWSGGIGAYHKDHGASDNCHIGWAGWERIYIGKGMRLWTYSPNVGGVENVTNNQPWWNYVHQRPQVAFGECDHPGYTEATCPFCYRETLQLR